ncbi:hypothetical protein M9Y10_032761 [Tritrichomonas musculus]|uniref:non-specific serine/threonine protein kinase n=1 Tax=Tritrichomonas musculus TaxID=1915356 RepID=A0ABR2GYU1_9EUKA
MELRKLVIPENFQEIRKVYHDYKRLIFNVWCNMHYHELKIATQSMLTQINSIVKSNDPQKSVKACIGISVLGKLRPIRLEHLLKQLSNLLPCDEFAYSEFISCMLAKFCRTHYLKEIKFITQQLARCNEWLHKDYPSSQVTCALQLLHWFAQFASSGILNSSQQFFDALSVGQYHQSYEVRKKAHFIACTFYERSLKGPIVLSAFNQSLTLINSKEINEIHGSLLVISNFAKYYPNLISDRASSLMKTCRFLMIHDQRCISSAAIHLIIELGPLNPVKFRAKYCEAINFYFFKEKELPEDLAYELITVMTYFPDIYSQKVLQIIPFLPTLIEKGNSAGFQLIKTISDILPQNEFLNLKGVNEIISNAPFNQDFSEVIVPLFESHPILWENLKNKIAERFLEVKEFHPVHLTIIASLPTFSTTQNEKLFELVRPLLSSNDPDIKSKAPAALFSLNRDISSESYESLLNEVLSICVREPKRLIRLEILNSIKPPYSEYLSFPHALEFFSLLVNDDSFSVRRAALSILGDLSNDHPSMILPIFRRVLLDSLFICDSSPLLRLQAQTTSCLAMIIRFADPILPVYIPVFIPIAFCYLQSRYGRKSGASGLSASSSSSNSYLSGSSSLVLHNQADFTLEHEPSYSFLSQHLSSSFSLTHIESQDNFTGNVPLMKRITQQTHFEQEYSSYIVVNFVDTIALSCQKQKSILEEKYVELTNLLLDILEQNTNKLIAISCLKCLSYVIDYVGPSAAFEFPSLLQTLFNLGSKFTSSKIHACIFKVYGRLGPIAPNGLYENHLSPSEDENETNILLDVSQIGNLISYSDWYFSVCASALLFILEDSNLSSLHYQALKILSSWPLITSPSSQPFFNKFVNYLIMAVGAAPADEKDQYFPLLHSVLKVNREWTSPFPSLFARLIEELIDTPFIQHALDLTPEVVKSLGDAFAPYLPKIVTILLDTLFNTEMSQPRIAIKILFALTKLSSFASDYVFIILRQMGEVVFNPMLKSDVVLSALQAMTKLVRKYDCSNYMALLARSIFQCITHQDEKIRNASIILLVSLQPNILYENYKQTAVDLLKSKNLFNENAETLMNTSPELLVINDPEDEGSEKISFSSSNKDSSIEFGFLECSENIELEQNSNSNSNDELSTNESLLIKSSICDSSFSQGQWKDWCRSFILTTIKESPSKVIQQCYGIAHLCYGFAVKLFHSAFLSCLSKLTENGKNVICDSLARALNESGTPMNVLITLVGLAEFMERADQHLNISYLDLAKAALRAEKLPFALFCIQKLDKLTSSSYEALFRIYSHMSMEENVHGLIHILRSRGDIQMSPKRAELLGDWTIVLRLYKENQSSETFISLLSSYSMFSDWSSIRDLYIEKFDNLPATVKSETAPFFARAFYNLKDWEKFDQTIKHAPTDSVESIMTQCLANKERKMPYEDLIVSGFDTLGTNAGPLFSHGFSSLIPFLVQAEQLVEIQEQGNNEENWILRTKNASLTFQQIQPLLMMRINILGGIENAQNEILTLLKMSRNSGEWTLHDHYFNLYYPSFNLKTTNPYVIFEHCVSLWKRQEKEKAIEILDVLIKDRLQKNLNDHENDLLIRALTKKAKWIIRGRSLGDNESEKLIESASICDQVMNYSNNRKVKLFYSYTQLRLYNIKEGDRSEHAINAIKCFISCSEGISEMMQLCSIFFRAGKYSKVLDAVEEDMENLKLELCLPLMPQLFTQLGNTNKRLAAFAEKTIRAALMKHHHLVIIPLLSAPLFMSNVREICLKMLDDFKRKMGDVYQGALVIFEGLLSACMTKTEKWLDALNNIIEFYKQGNVDMMKNTFEQMFSTIKTQNSDSDLLFNRLYADKISSIAPSFRRFFTSRNKRHIDELLPEFRSLCAAMKNEIEGMSSIPTRFIAPLLSEIRNVKIAVLGTYEPEITEITDVTARLQINTIAKFSASMDVFPSKQRPKRFAIVGSDGREFWYLLKGHEDLRLDQRVIQLFSLLNKFIPSSMPKIITNFILPLSPSVGVIQWIPGSDTMFKLIREFRASKGLQIDVEARLMMGKTIQKFDNLRPIQRLEAMKEVNDETADDTLADIFWLKAPNSESWTRRVSTFSKTSALMSVVGYIIGLGDRHPSNLMIHKFTGSVIHVDFGDCFEFAKDRVRFPELIPFRLTRFMIKAFGPCGIDGSFRQSCINMIALIRKNREAVISSLEIFTHAPPFFNNQSSLAALSSSVNVNNEEDSNLNSNETSVANSGSENRNRIEMEENMNRLFDRIYDKINGNDFNATERLSQEEQVNEMIKAATDTYNMAHLYHGWKPLW